MPEVRRLNLQFPAAGLVQDKAYQQSPPYATQDALNCRPENVFNHRRMGGSRPGVMKAFDQSLGATPRFLGTVTYIKENDTRTAFQDNFDCRLYPSGIDWSTCSWLASALTCVDGFMQGETNNTTEAGMTLKDIDIGSDYTVENLIYPFLDPQGTSIIFKVYLRMNTVTPVGTTDGIEVTLTLPGSVPSPATNYSITVKKYVAGVVTTLGSYSGLIVAQFSGQSWGWLKLNVVANDLTITWSGTTIVTSLALPAAAGRRVAVTIKKSSTAGGYLVPGRIETFRIRYAGTPNRERTVAVAVAGGDVWRETELGVIAQSSSTMTLASDRRINGAEYLQKMYFADYALKVSTTGTFGVDLTTTVTDAVLTSNVATLTCGSTNVFHVGQYVTINLIKATPTGYEAVYNGIHKLTAVTATTVSYAQAHADIASNSYDATSTISLMNYAVQGSFSGYGIDFDEDVLEYEFRDAAGIILGGGVTPIIDEYSSYTYLILRDSVIPPDGTVTSNCWVWRGAKIYDPAADTLTLWTTETRVPEVFNITGVSAADGVVTFTTSPAHKFKVGDRVSVAVNPVTGLPLGTGATPLGTTLSNTEINGVFEITETDAIESAPTTFKAIKPIGTDTLNDIAARKIVQGFKKKVTAAGATNPNKVKIKTTTNHGFTVGDFVTVAGVNALDIDGTWYLSSGGVIGVKEIELTAPVSTFAATDAGYKLWGGEVYTAKGTAQLADYQGKGFVPAGCRLIAFWRGRAVLARGNTIYYSRIGDPLDFDFGQTDEGAAIATPLTDTGVIGQEVTAICPIDSDSIVFGCKNQLWRQTGDPAAQGKLYNLSREVGIVADNAFCITPDGVLVFLSNFGIYACQAKGGLPAPVTQRPLPESMRYIDDSFEVSLAYDTRDKGVHIFLTKQVALTSHWFMDWQEKGFWPVIFASDGNDPFCAVDYAGRDSTDNCVLMGCRDGYIRRHRDNQGTDDGIPFSSYLVFGPIRLSGNTQNNGTIAELICNPVQDADLVTRANVSLKIGYNHQECLTATSRFDANFQCISTGTGNNRDSVRPTLSGGSLALVVGFHSSWPTIPWALENLSALCRDDGPARRR